MLKNRKKKVNMPVCTSEIPLPTPVGYFKSKLGRLGYYCSSLPTENLCRPIVLLYLYIIRFWVEMSFQLTLRGINDEQKDAVQQLFESNGWPWNVEVTDVCKLYTLKHSPLFAASRYSQVTTFGTELATHISSARLQGKRECWVWVLFLCSMCHHQPSILAQDGAVSPSTKLWD